MRSALPRLSSLSLLRRFHATAPQRLQAVKQKEPTSKKRQTYKYADDGTQETESLSAEAENLRFVKRNAVGVQMLSGSLHAQIFKNCSFPPPGQSFVNISRAHLETHALDPSQSSTLPITDFTLPTIQGNNLLEHFHRIGMASAEPYRSMASDFATATLPPAPEDWAIQPGWTKYHHNEDGSGHCEYVPYPIHDGKPEQLLSFDVETMPKYHPYPILACAASPNAWYAWISPWLLDDSNDPQQLISLGPSDVPRVVVGHNVSYDRARIQEEYHLHGSRNRFLDTMSLHVAVKGISSHQRPAWMKYRKQKDGEFERKKEAMEAILVLMDDVEAQLQEELDNESKEKLITLQQNLQASLPKLHDCIESHEQELNPMPVDLDPEDGNGLERRWEDLTSANSLKDVAKLHCNIDISKEIRDDLLKETPDHIRANITDYLSYCASDVSVTHQVYQQVFPKFLSACPHPASFAGIITMGSGFLPVNQEWEKYLRNAEETYMKMERQVRDGLALLAREAMEQFNGKDVSEIDDVWLKQLDWTPKKAGKTRGVEATSEDLEPASVPLAEALPTAMDPSTGSAESSIPAWYNHVQSDPFSSKSLQTILPLLLRLSYDGHPLWYTKADKWHYVDSSGLMARLPTARPGKQTSTLLSKAHVLRLLKADDGKLTSCNDTLAQELSSGQQDDSVRDKVAKLAEDALSNEPTQAESDPWLSQLDWTAIVTEKKRPKKGKAEKPPKHPPVFWPKWYWDLAKPKKDMPPGSLDITIRNRISPLLLRLSWKGHPLFYSRQHGWTFRVHPDSISPEDASFKRMKPLNFYDAADESLADMVLREGYIFCKLPHKDGDKANVGSPLAKTFMKFTADGTLSGKAGDNVQEIVDVGAQCSYWISARDRILNQMVSWQKSGGFDMGFKVHGDASRDPDMKWGVIIPQVLTMGTVTRRAIEKTWLTASNAKKNRVGSELKAMVRAPPGFAIVGADVDSEELWISSCMGDAQFGFHGASAIGWMTLEGTKSAGTDLHSKTASILGISRDQAKVFNYSRIYGAGMRHAVLLLLQGSTGMAPEEAQKLAENLYASTKGKNTHRTDIFDRKFWYGGTESYLFNKLEEIALSDKPETPALGCGVTDALSKEYLPTDFGSDYMPSRINWVVQSSGVDYLHLLIVSMDHLIRKYNIKARYLISVHDELRYLAQEDDKYRAALALQIANLWTRSMFAYKLGMDDLPQGVAFFSAVDVDHVLRKEVDMPCVTPSHPTAIPPGESLDIQKILSQTNNGSLLKDGGPMQTDVLQAYEGSLKSYVEPDCMVHRSKNAAFLRAQATSDFNEIKHLAKTVYGKSFEDAPTGAKRQRRKQKKRAALGNGDGVDWAHTVEQLLQSGRDLNLVI